MFVEMSKILNHDIEIVNKENYFVNELAIKDITANIYFQEILIANTNILFSSFY